MTPACRFTLDELKESAAYLRWALKKRRQDPLAEHEVFFEALIDELDDAVRILSSN